MPPNPDLTPDEELAEQIANRLVEAGFVDAARGEAVAAKIATGSCPWLRRNGSISSVSQPNCPGASAA